MPEIGTYKKEERYQKKGTCTEKKTKTALAKYGNEAGWWPVDTHYVNV